MPRSGRYRAVLLLALIPSVALPRSSCEAQAGGERAQRSHPVRRALLGTAVGLTVSAIAVAPPGPGSFGTDDIVAGSIAATGAAFAVLAPRLNAGPSSRSDWTVSVVPSAQVTVATGRDIGTAMREQGLVIREQSCPLGYCSPFTMPRPDDQYRGAALVAVARRARGPVSVGVLAGDAPRGLVVSNTGARASVRFSGLLLAPMLAMEAGPLTLGAGPALMRARYRTATEELPSDPHPAGRVVRGPTLHDVAGGMLMDARISTAARRRLGIEARAQWRAIGATRVEPFADFAGARVRNAHGFAGVGVTLRM